MGRAKFRQFPSTVRHGHEPATLCLRFRFVQSQKALAKRYEVSPTTIHTVLTDNGQQFCDAPRSRSGPTARCSRHMFDRACDEHGIEHRLTKPNHPWTNGQVERMNRILKDATVKRDHYESHAQLRTHLQSFGAFRSGTLMVISRVGPPRPPLR
ncbi:putative transposase [Azorhizobium caulinodans ORS 571]|uniref:Putative transposase n=1 Tax=Azorhizobium caulinodans (strain ATCC 43989 / DSM 5975 / JCM 20966 / LMG 6465 / NBRC 14845 / NCIMB 13405 / ORS 571) TaxID=438753 RepID=A8ICT8_AZOC5|nr:putative transposase [Azorhizobium caulinodans ORS 571]